MTAAERDAALSAILDAGLVDLDVRRWGRRQRRFTWWRPGFGYSRNLGMRIDLLAADHVLADRLHTTWIDHVGRSGERPSDHAALSSTFGPPTSDSGMGAFRPPASRVIRAAGVVQPVAWRRGPERVTMNDEGRPVVIGR